MSRIGAIVLAAGTSSRFGGSKLLARLGTRSILQCVLDSVAGATLDPVVVVLGRDAEAIEQAIAWRDERRLVNPAPEAGLSGSVWLAFQALANLRPPIDAAIVLLGDQPLVTADILGVIAGRPLDPAHPMVVPRYADGANPNPMRLERAAWPLVDGMTGDRGLGPLVAARPDLVREVPFDRLNPDVDTHADLAALAWAERVIANRDQVDRCREVPDAADFYAPLTARFVDDPRRTDDEVLDVLRGLVRHDDVLLDIGAGAGRYALPLALIAREVVAIDPSDGMLAALRGAMDDHGIRNVRTVSGRWPIPGWPPPDVPPADVALIANVGYDIAEIGPFLDAMEANAERLCVAVLMERQPSSIAAPFWPPIHGEARVPLPALDDFVALLEARGTPAEVTRLERPPRGFPDRSSLSDFVRGQLWLSPGGEKDHLLQELLDPEMVSGEGGVRLRDQRTFRVGVVRWAPPHVLGGP